MGFFSLVKEVDRKGIWRALDWDCCDINSPVDIPVCCWMEGETEQELLEALDLLLVGDSDDMRGGGIKDNIDKH